MNEEKKTFNEPNTKPTHNLIKLNLNEYTIK